MRVVSNDGNTRGDDSGVIWVRVNLTYGEAMRICNESIQQVDAPTTHELRNAIRKQIRWTKPRK